MRLMNFVEQELDSIFEDQNSDTPLASSPAKRTNKDDTKLRFNFNETSLDIVKVLLNSGLDVNSYDIPELHTAIFYL